ncbi:MAG: hypothetical protein HN929_10695 [Chloroflexi bacterium]|jgi:hypothetical protein|nr:hypothetical protein [Chloroflexota bacterium]MBT7081912.1 hypothetical protein [Chloroflexota bacterium]MBT7289817.1 hypothetical protein [Chloroflexota bacterium]
MVKAKIGDTSHKSGLVLPQSLEDKTNIYRGKLTRTEFLEFCIDWMAINITDAQYTKHTGNSELTQLKADVTMHNTAIAPTENDSNTYVTRDDFAEFKHHVNELQKSLIEFVLTSMMDNGSTIEQNGIEQEVKKLQEV